MGFSRQEYWSGVPLPSSPSLNYPKYNYQPKNEEIHQTKKKKKKVPFGTVFTIIYILKISNEQPSIKGIED